MSQEKQEKLVGIDDINLGVVIESDEIDKVVDTSEGDFSECPHCGCTDILYGDEEPEGSLIYRVHTCNSCGTKWEERYDLVRVIVTTPPKEIKVGEVKRFYPTVSDLQHFTGEQVKVIEVIEEPDAEHDSEVLPMYVLDIKKDGKNVEAFCDELKEV